MELLCLQRQASIPSHASKQTSHTKQNTFYKKTQTRSIEFQRGEKAFLLPCSMCISIASRLLVKDVSTSQTAEKTQHKFQ